MTLHPRETVILAEDFQALVDWYKSVLGFRATRLFEGEYHYCNLENESGIRLGIAVAKEMGVSPGDRKNNTVIFGPSQDKNDGFWYGGFTDLEGNPCWVVDESCP